MTDTRKLSPLGYLVAWLPGAALAAAVIWVDKGPVWGLRALTGPWIILWGRWSTWTWTGTILYLLFFNLPLIAGIALLIKYRDRPGRILRFLFVAALSFYWYASVFLLLIMLAIILRT